MPHLLAPENLNSLQLAYHTGYLLCIWDTIHELMDSKQIKAMVSLDVSAPLDTVNHKTLLQRLHKDFGVTDISLR
jgi:hypothetical protein